MDKEGHKFVLLYFVGRMTADAAIACDPVVQRAFEDCEDLERKISKVDLRVEVEDTDVHLFEVPDAKERLFLLEHVKLEQLACERIEGITYLYFACAVARHRRGFWPFYGDWYNATVFAEFRASQLPLPSVTLEAPAPEKKKGKKK